MQVWLIPIADERVDVQPRNKRAVQIPPRTISGFARVELMKVLGVTMS